MRSIWRNDVIREPNDRRWKFCAVSPYEILSLFLDWSRGPECFAQAHFEGIPDDVIIDGVIWDEMMQKIKFCLYHPSFDIIGSGDILPYVESKFDGFFLPKCRSAEEARRLATWMYKPENERLAEFFTELADSQPRPQSKPKFKIPFLPEL